MKRAISILLILCCAATAAAGEQIAARVNGAVITTQDVDMEVNRIIPSVSYHGSVSDERRDELKGVALDDLITKELQYQDAVSKGVKPDPALVREQLEKIRDRFKSEKDFQNALHDAGLTENTLKKRVEKDVVVYLMVKQTIDDPSRQTDEMLKDYYDHNTEKFVRPAGFRLRIISCQAEKKAQAALTKLHNGEDFGRVAAEMSEDRYRIKGGDIGFVHKGRIYPELEEAAFNMEKGEISGLIRAQGTWFIIKLEEKTPEHRMTFDEVKDTLKRSLEKKRHDELREKWISELKAKARIEVLMKSAEKEVTSPHGQHVP